MNDGLELRCRGDRVRVEQAQLLVREEPVERWTRALLHASDRRPSCALLPRNVRIWHERRDAAAVAIEIPPHTRSVRWISPSSRKPFGRGASYRTHHLAFPYVILLIVFRRGCLCGLHQLYYRTRPLDQDDELYLPNLLNVAAGYGQKAWVCLQNVPPLRERSWSDRVDAIVEHVFWGAFNRSGEMHEGNSYWTSVKPPDPRVATLDAWHAATRENPWFVLDVRWHPARTHAQAELSAMLDQAVMPRSFRSTEDLAAALMGWEEDE